MCVCVCVHSEGIREDVNSDECGKCVGVYKGVKVGNR